MEWSDERFLFRVMLNGEPIERCETRQEALSVCDSLNRIGVNALYNPRYIGPNRYYVQPA